LSRPEKSSSVMYRKAILGFSPPLALIPFKAWGYVRRLLAALGFVLLATTLRAQAAPPPQADAGGTNPPSTTGSTNLTNQANNPVTPLPELLVQNYLMPAPQGYDGRLADEQLLRFYWPFMVSGVQNILRIYQPIVTNPLFPHGRDAGLGDTTVFDLALHKQGMLTLGGGPLLVVPSASHDNMGDGKFQAGVAGGVVMETSWGLLATIVTYSHSFSGYGSGRPSTQVVGVQPLAHYNFNYGYYLRSSGIWNFDYGDFTSVIPIGFGAGKVTRLRSGIITNMYIEFQRAVHYTGTGSPIWEILTAINLQFENYRTKPKQP
jgi:hypothetical protein